MSVGGGAMKAGEAFSGSYLDDKYRGKNDEPLVGSHSRETSDVTNSRIY